MGTLELLLPKLNNMNLSGIKTIIFDLGGVLLNIDYHLTINAFEKLGFEDFESTFSQFKQSNMSDLYEKGVISSVDFYKSIITDDSVAFQDFETAWNTLLIDFPESRFNLLQNLSDSFSLFLCSNTNEMHYEAFQKIVNQYDDDFDSLFTRAYYSHHISLRKPDKEIFEYILSENNLIANEVLFVDDSIQHIETAKGLGIKTIHIKNKTIEEIFADWIK
jgi:putative hydrolase of the HAD superfamily